MRNKLSVVAVVALLIFCLITGCGCGYDWDGDEENEEEYYYQIGIWYNNGRMSNAGAEVVDSESLYSSYGGEDFECEEIGADFETSAFEDLCDVFLCLESTYFEDPEIEEGCIGCIDSSRETEYTAEMRSRDGELLSFEFSLEIQKSCCDCPSEYDEEAMVDRCYKNDQFMMIFEIPCPRDEDAILFKISRLDRDGKKATVVFSYSLSGLEVPYEDEYEEYRGYD